MSGRFSAGDRDLPPCRKPVAQTSVPHSLSVAARRGRLVAVTEPSLDVMALSTNTWLASPPQLPPAPSFAETIAFEQNPTGCRREDLPSGGQQRLPRSRP